MYSPQSYEIICNTQYFKCFKSSFLPKKRQERIELYMNISVSILQHIIIDEKDILSVHHTIMIHILTLSCC